MLPFTFIAIWASNFFLQPTYSKYILISVEEDNKDVNYFEGRSLPIIVPGPIPGQISNYYENIYGNKTFIIERKGSITINNIIILNVYKTTI